MLLPDDSQQDSAIGAKNFAVDAPSLPLTDDSQGWFNFHRDGALPGACSASR